MPHLESLAEELRACALAVLLEADADRKSAMALRLTAQVANALPVDTVAMLAVPEALRIPGRGERPLLVAHSLIKPQPMRTLEGRAMLLHALAHIELNAIDLAADAVWRFAGMPEAYYRDWVRVLQEEALHFQLLRDHLASLGFAYGDFPAHDSLWAMAERTQHDVLARMALVPRTLEARGLDASPGVRNKLVSAGDQAGAAIITIILRDEIGHVAIGNRWYAWLCGERGLEPLATYAALATLHRAPRLHGPYNLEARRAAGFLEEELAQLGNA